MLAMRPVDCIRGVVAHSLISARLRTYVLDIALALEE